MSENNEKNIVSKIVDINQHTIDGYRNLVETQQKQISKLTFAVCAASTGLILMTIAFMIVANGVTI